MTTQFAEQVQSRSPSRVFYQFGQYITQGLANGITESASGPLSAIANLGKEIAAALGAITSATNGALGGIGSAVAGAAGGGVGGRAGSGSPAAYSGGSFNSASWARAFLRAGGFAETASNIKAVQVWEQFEGTFGRFDNPLDTTQSGYGGVSINSVGVKKYPSINAGINASLATLRNGHYGAIIAALKAGNSAYDVELAIDKSPWGTHIPLGSYDAGGYLPPGLSLAWNGLRHPEKVGGGGDTIVYQLNVPQGAYVGKPEDVWKQLQPWAERMEQLRERRRLRGRPGS